MSATTEEKQSRRIKANITRLFIEGYWFCYGCEQLCERNEGEQGQPAHCALCGSTFIKYHPPAWMLEAL